MRRHPRTLAAVTDPAAPAEPDARTASQPSIGLGVAHLFWKLTPRAERTAVLTALKQAEADGDQVVTVAVLGHKADLAVMVVGDDLWRLRRVQTDLQRAGLELVDSYVSLTELSESTASSPTLLDSPHPTTRTVGRAGSFGASGPLRGRWTQ